MFALAAVFADNKWLGTNSNLLGTDAWAKFVVTYHNKMSTDHKVPCLGAGGVALRIYEKGLAFILFQVCFHWLHPH